MCVFQFSSKKFHSLVDLAIDLCYHCLREICFKTILLRLTTCTICLKTKYQNIVLSTCNDTELLDKASTYTPISKHRILENTRGLGKQYQNLYAFKL